MSGYELGAVDFISPSFGVGLTAASVPCYRLVKLRLSDTEGWSGGLREQQQRLAVTFDGGSSWELEGAPPTARLTRSIYTEQVFAMSPSEIWALTADGALWWTVDSGSTWTRVRVGGPVLTVARSGERLWVLSCAVALTPSGCAARLTIIDAITGASMQADTGAFSTDTTPQMSAQPANNAVIEASQYPDGAGELMVSSDGGRRWHEQPAPDWQGHQCWSSSTLATSGSTWWLLCGGNGAAGSVTQGLMRSTNAGRSWRVASQVTSLQAPYHPHGLTAAGVCSIAATGPNLLWLSLCRGGLGWSVDGGRRWSYVPAGTVDSGGWGTAFDVLSQHDLWLLAPGIGLWRTIDGPTWEPVGPVNDPSPAPHRAHGAAGAVAVAASAVAVAPGR